ncbi:MAG: hypothetical protein LBN43_02625 [Oscillospiraceae bacterium]|jgi:hypothetical protein|nr:hypothetical protein [Oscillospiraceae bacterium]
MIPITDWQVRRADGNQLIPAKVPGTVLASYIDAGIVPNPLYDDNWNKLITRDDFFNFDFEYRAIFVLPERNPNERVTLNFDAINWKADVYVNGKKQQHGNREHSIEGAFIRRVFDITDSARFGETNVLEVLIIRNDTPGLVTFQGLAEGPGPNGGLLGADNPTLHASVGWDWMPTIPGRNIGIYGEVYLTSGTGAEIIDPWIETKLGITEKSAVIASVNLLNGFEAWSGGEGGALTVDLGSEQTVGGVTLLWGTESGGAAADLESRFPALFRLESSADGKTWRNFSAFNGGEVEVRFFGLRNAEPNGGISEYEGHSISDSIQGGTAIVPMDLTSFNMGNVDMPIFAPQKARYIRFTALKCRELNGKAVDAKIQDMKIYAESPEQVEQSTAREYNLDDSETKLTLRCEVRNPYDSELTPTVKLDIEELGVSVRRPLTLAPNETVSVEIPLTVKKPKLWWPNTYGEQYLYVAKISGDGIFEDKTFKFGVREFTYPTDGNILTIYCNGTRIVCKGGNWGMDDALKGDTAEILDAKVHLHAHANMTMIRNWIGMTNHSAFYDACDKYGVLIWDDFWLANPVDGPNPNDYAMFLENAEDKIKKNRAHAALACYCGRNEGDPPEPLFSALPELCQRLDPTRVYFQNSASAPVGSGGGYSLALPGGNRGIKQYFDDVTSPVLRSERGIPNVPNLESLKKFLTPEHLWPINEVWALHDWTYHMNGPANSYMAALKTYLGGEFDIPEDNVQGQKPDASDPVFKRYKADVYKMIEQVGKIYTIEQFSKAAQMINYDNHRGLFDSLSVRRSNGLLMWMSQSSWPSFMWQTYDYFLDCNGGYYGAKAGCAPVKAIFDPRTEEIVVSNATPNRYEKITVEVTLYNLNGKLVDKKLYDIETLEPDTYGLVIAKADFSKSDTDVCFLRLNETTYWHNRKNYQDYRAIGALPEPTLSLASGDKYLSVFNTGDTPAVCLRLRITDDDGNDILPVYWSDNYFTLMPGESTTVIAQFSNSSNKALHFKVNSYSEPLLSST